MLSTKLTIATLADSTLVTLLNPQLSTALLLVVSSFHPTHIFKSIDFSEAICLRQLNETQSDYLASLERLKQNCIYSQLNS